MVKLQRRSNWRTMIKDSVIAQQVSDLMVEFGGRLNDSIIVVQEQCSPEEFKAYRLAVAKIMAEMLLEVMNPLYAQHPSIKPPELE
jgi:hypothetical protein